MISLIYLIITIFLDNICNLFFNYSYQNLSIVTPMFTVASLIIIFVFIKNKTIFLIISLLIGLIYDLLYSNIFICSYLFFVLGIIIIYFYKKRKPNLLNSLILSIIILITYDSLLFFYLVLLDYSSFTINDLIYKLSNSLIINIIYVLISYCILYKSLKKAINH